MAKDRVWAVVPIKTFSDAKSRLAPALGQEQRRNLASLMAERVLKATLASPEIARTLVVTADPAAERLALRLGAEPCLLAGDHGVNAAVEAGFRQARQYCETVLILPSDVPLAGPEDLARLLAPRNRDKTVRIVADKAGQGTNALSIPAGADFTFHFGENSASAHAEAAGLAGLRVEFHHIANLALDIDSADDLEALRDCNCSWLRNFDMRICTA